MNPVTPLGDPRWGTLAGHLDEITQSMNHALIEESNERSRAQVAALVATAKDARKRIKATCEAQLDELVWETTNTDPDPARVTPREALLQSLFVPYLRAMVNIKAHAVAAKYKLPEFGELAADALVKLIERFTRPTRNRPARNQQCDPVRPVVEKRPRRKDRPLPNWCAACGRGVTDAITDVLRRDSAVARDLPTADKLDGYVYTSVLNAARTVLRTKMRDAVFAHLEAGFIEQASSSAVVSRSMQRAEFKRQLAAKKAAAKQKTAPAADESAPTGHKVPRGRQKP